MKIIIFYNYYIFDLLMVCRVLFTSIKLEILKFWFIDLSFKQIEIEPPPLNSTPIYTLNLEYIYKFIRKNKFL